MVADRISLITIYRSLLPIDRNDGKIESILLNRKNDYGTKSIPKFNSLEELKEFIDSFYPYVPASNCNCLTSNEGIYNLVSFSFKNKGELVYVNNLPNRFETAKPDKINNIHFKGLTKIKSINVELNKLYGEYVCFPYIEYGYIGCDYIEMVTNERYDDLITLYKKIK
jgi:hypothetical protein